MAFWNSFVDAVVNLGNGVADVVETIASVAETAVNAVSGAVTDLEEAVGNGIQDGAVWIAEAAENIPIIGVYVGTAVRWAGDVVSAGAGLIAGVHAGIVTGVTGLATGLFRMTWGIITGTLSGNWSLLRKGLDTLAASLFSGFILLPGGKLVAFVQAIVPINSNNKRKLTRLEISILKRIYRNSLALYNIRVVDGAAGFFSLNNIPFTFGNVIYLKNDLTKNNPLTFVHESLHVWQYQKEGGVYLGLAIGAEWFRELHSGDPYVWESEISNGTTEWANFNMEAQAQFVEDVYRSGVLVTGTTTNTNQGVFYDADGKLNIGQFIMSKIDHTVRANAAVEVIRNKFSIRATTLFNDSMERHSP